MPGRQRRLGRPHLMHHSNTARTPLHRRQRGPVIFDPCRAPVAQAPVRCEDAKTVSGSLRGASRLEGIMLAMLTIGITLAVGIPGWAALRRTSENRVAEASLELGVKDTLRVYMVERAFAPPNPHAELWPYLDKRFPLLRWGKASADPNQIAVGRSTRGRRQSVELSVFAMDGVCWEAIAVMSTSSVAIARWAGLLSPGIYYGATIARSCGPSYVTRPTSGWQTMLSRVKVSGQF